MHETCHKPVVFVESLKLLDIQSPYNVDSYNDSARSRELQAQHDLGDRMLTVTFIMKLFSNIAK